MKSRFVSALVKMLDTIAATQKPLLNTEVLDMKNKQARKMHLAMALAFIALTVLFAAASSRRLQVELSSPQKKEVNIRAADGVLLKGTFYSANKPGPGILLSHMCDGKGRATWDDLATRLAQAGFHVLTWNYRGVGDSGGEPFRGGTMQQVMEYWRTQWGADLDAALKLLQAQPGVDAQKIGAGGASCGVYLSLLLAERHPQQVKTLVLLAGPVDDDLKKFIANADALPILGVTSEEDTRSTGWTKEITGASKNPATKLVVYKDAGHGTQMLAKEKELEPLIVEWFKAKLQR